MFCREYPCDQVASLNLALLNAGCPRAEIQELAVQLLRLLYKRFFMDDVITDHTITTDRDDGRDSVFIEERRILREGLFSGCSYGAQMQLSNILAELHPDQTMPMFSGTVIVDKCVFIRCFCVIKSCLLYESFH